MHPQQIQPEIKIWKTIEIGGYADNIALKKAVMKSGRKISSWANDMMNCLVVTESRFRLGLAIASPKELGFKNGGDYGAIRASGQKSGLSNCPREIAPQLASEYRDQPKGESLVVAMEPIRDESKTLGIFCVDHDLIDGPRFSAYYGGPGRFWGPNTRFIFVKLMEPLQA